LKASAIMLLKTNIEKMSVLGLAIISLKIKDLSYSAIMYMKINELSSNRSSKNRDGGVRQRPLWFCPLVRFNDVALTTRRVRELGPSVNVRSTCG
jgi:hypothetical protein